jgi:NhaP-type Na+/H+ or K+/H+ antiporter
MSEFSAESLISILALVGAVIIVSTLLSGVMERSGFPQVAAFLLLGALLGPAGLNMLHVTLESPILRIVATLGLALVLFTDAVSLNLDEVRRAGNLTLLVLGPGTLLSAGLVAFAGWGLLGLSPAAAIILGAALASTDPVLLRGLLRRPEVSPTARQVLRLESGLNDVVLLPIVLVAMGFLGHSASTDPLYWARLALDLLILGPGAGVLVAVFGIATLDMIRKRVGIRRDYESLYSLGIALTAYAAAEAVHGSGFLAAFAAGLTIATLDVELCDCFLEYGETTAELILLFTFVLFGSVLIWSGFAILTGLVVLFAVLTLFVRPVAFLLSLAKVRLSRRDRLLIAWFGPRGLSSLLLILLPVFAGLPGSDYLFAICSLVVLLSVVVHGSAPMLLVRRTRRQLRNGATQSPIEQEAQIQPELPRQSPEPVVQQETAGPDGNKPLMSEKLITIDNAPKSLRISLQEVRQLWQQKATVILLDVRTLRSYDSSEAQAAGSIRLSPDEAVKQVKERGLPYDTWLVAYCT